MGRSQLERDDRRRRRRSPTLFARYLDDWESLREIHDNNLSKENESWCCWVWLRAVLPLPTLTSSTLLTSPLLRIYSGTARARELGIVVGPGPAFPMVECQRGHGNGEPYPANNTAHTRYKNTYDSDFDCLFFSCLTVRNRDRPAGKVLTDVTRWRSSPTFRRQYKPKNIIRKTRNPKTHIGISIRRTHTKFEKKNIYPVYNVHSVYVFYDWRYIFFLIESCRSKRVKGSGIFFFDRSLWIRRKHFGKNNKEISINSLQLSAGFSTLGASVGRSVGESVVDSSSIPNRDKRSLQELFWMAVFELKRRVVYLRVFGVEFLRCSNCSTRWRGSSRARRTSSCCERWSTQFGRKIDLKNRKKINTMECGIAFEPYWSWKPTGDDCAVPQSQKSRLPVVQTSPEGEKTNQHLEVRCLDNICRCYWKTEGWSDPQVVVVVV